MIQEYMQKANKDYHSNLRSLIIQRCISLGYDPIPQRLHNSYSNDGPSLWYYIQDDGTMTPLIAFSETNIEYSGTEDIFANSITVTMSCREISMDVFKPRK